MAKRKKEEAAAPGAPLWMASYGDLVTNLLCLFVLLFALSNVDQEKVNALAAGMAARNNITTIFEQPETSTTIYDLMGNGILEMPTTPISSASQNDTEVSENYIRSQEELDRMASSFKTYFAQQNLQSKISVAQEEELVRIRFADDILFDVGRAFLRTDVLPILDMVANELSKYPDSDIIIEGHTDTDPIHTVQYPSNMYLSAARAISVFEYFVEDKALSPDRFSAEGMGEYRPVAANDTNENKAKNRRVEIKIYTSFNSKQSTQ